MNKINEKKELIKKIVKDKDNVTTTFPLECIQNHLTFFYIDRTNYKVHLENAVSTLHLRYNKEIAGVFLSVVERTFPDGIDTYEDNDYIERTEVLINTLESIKITIIPKMSPDGQLLTALQ